MAFKVLLHSGLCNRGGGVNFIGSDYCGVGLMGILGTLLGTDGAVNAAKLAGSAVSNIMDRFVPKKMSESEKWGAVKDQMAHEKDVYGLEVTDVNKARDMYIALLKNQKLPWFIVWINALYRPWAGVMAIMYLFDKVWSQWLLNIWPTFSYIPVDRDVVVDAVAGLIVGFFFGMRQLSKQRGTTTSA